MNHELHAMRCLNDKYKATKGPESLGQMRTKAFTFFRFVEGRTTEESLKLTNHMHPIGQPND